MPKYNAPEDFTYLGQLFAKNKFKATYESKEIQQIIDTLSKQDKFPISSEAISAIKDLLETIKAFRQDTHHHLKVKSESAREDYTQASINILIDNFKIKSQLENNLGFYNSDVNGYGLIKDILDYSGISLEKRIDNLNKKNKKSPPLFNLEEITTAAITEQLKNQQQETVNHGEPSQTNEPKEDYTGFEFSWDDIVEPNNSKLIGSGAYGNIYLFKVKEGTPTWHALNARGLFNPGSNEIVGKELNSRSLTTSDLKAFQMEGAINDVITADYNAQLLEYQEALAKYQKKLEENPGNHDTPPTLPLPPVNPASFATTKANATLHQNQVIFSKYAKEGKLSKYIEKLRQKELRENKPGTDWADFCLKQFEALLHRTNDLHNMGFLHKDLALRNILTLGEGENTILTLTDLGLAKAIDPKTQKVIEESNTGPIRWMSQQALRSKTHDRGTELYSLQLIMLQIIARAGGISTHFKYMRPTNFKLPDNLETLSPEEKDKLRSDINHEVATKTGWQGNDVMLTDFKINLKAELLKEKELKIEEFKNVYGEESDEYRAKKALLEYTHQRLDDLFKATEETLLSHNDLLTPEGKIEGAFAAIESAKQSLVTRSPPTSAETYSSRPAEPRITVEAPGQSSVSGSPNSNYGEPYTVPLPNKSPPDKEKSEYDGFPEFKGPMTTERRPQELSKTLPKTKTEEAPQSGYGKLPALGLENERAAENSRRARAIARPPLPSRDSHQAPTLPPRNEPKASSEHRHPSTENNASRDLHQLPPRNEPNKKPARPLPLIPKTTPFDTSKSKYKQQMPGTSPLIKGSMFNPKATATTQNSGESNEKKKEQKTTPSDSGTKLHQ